LRLAKALDLPIEPYPVTVPKMDKQTGKVKIHEAAIILPSDLFGFLHKDPARFRKVFGTPDQWALYWCTVRGERWFQLHPDKDRIQARPHEHCPHLIFGDDAQTSKRVGNNVKLLMWFSPFSESRLSADRMLPVYLVPTREKTFIGITNLLEHAAVWSFNAASTNKQPVSDQNG